MAMFNPFQKQMDQGKKMLDDYMQESDLLLEDTRNLLKNEDVSKLEILARLYEFMHLQNRFIAEAQKVFGK